MNDRAAKRIFKAKAVRRQELARLPFEEKIQIVVRLQKIAAGIRRGQGLKVWKLD